ncbi:hypothetical protein ALO92_05195, partial [Pseudomonas congelans]
MLGEWGRMLFPRTTGYDSPMAYYEKRGDAWRAQIRRKGYPTISATFDTKAEAQRWA